MIPKRYGLPVFAIMPSAAPDMMPPLATLLGKRVLVVGDVMLDRYWFGSVERISPEAPVPVVQVRREEERPGGAANVALNVVALGARAHLLAPVGDDQPGRHLAALLAAAQVESTLIPGAGCPTTVKLRVIGHQQQLLRMDFEARPSADHRGALLDRGPSLFAAAGAVILSDYAKGALQDVVRFVTMGRDLGVPVLVDPKGRDYERYRGATLLTPNQAEFQAVAGPWQDEDEFREMGQRLRRHLELQGLLVTRGEGGMTLFTESGIYHHSAQAREVFDVTGAGDTVIATLAVALAAAWPLDLAVELANRAAGIVVGKLGAAVASQQELQDSLSGST